MAGAAAERWVMAALGENGEVCAVLGLGYGEEERFTAEHAPLRTCLVPGPVALYAPLSPEQRRRGVQDLEGALARLSFLDAQQAEQAKHLQDTQAKLRAAEHALHRVGLLARVAPASDAAWAEAAAWCARPAD